MEILECDDGVMKKLVKIVTSAEHVDFTVSQTCEN